MENSSPQPPTDSSVNGASPPPVPSLQDTAANLVAALATAYAAAAAGKNDDLLAALAKAHVAQVAITQRSKHVRLASMVMAVTSLVLMAVAAPREVMAKAEADAA
ncbi:hypothetical protein E2562_010221 [Oryza meyeriana var. granulata]|uniref:Uncharacterized protein n=1 Tax=Oryza meyeriana var. granulata TaxID=110450 RepID=A0A6G1EJ46_9ORYZ|nr:hypothetical protein E2562_010221 [Oryza meyeriana var. granulata]